MTGFEKGVILGALIVLLSQMAVYSVFSFITKVIENKKQKRFGDFLEKQRRKDRDSIRKHMMEMDQLYLSMAKQNAERIDELLSQRNRELNT